MINRIKSAIENAIESIRDKHRRKKYGSNPKSGEGFTWISDDDFDDEEELDEEIPMFHLGDEVHIFSPHMGALYQDWDEISPNTYTVIDITYDDSDSNPKYHTFRYKLDGWEGGYVSEDWLSLPFYSKFEKDMKGAVNVKEMSVTEREEFFRKLDEKAQKREIDRLLDVMNSGSDAEITEARRRLSELSK